MATENQVEEVGGYGFESDEVKQNNTHFGGNFGNTFMTKFEFTNKGGKKDDQGNATDGEALDITFNINGTEKSYRQFPVTKAFDENNTEVTDPKHPAFIKAQKNFNSIMVMIIKCFVDENDVKAALAKRIDSFKDYCGILMGLLPKDFSKKPLDIFLQWQWQITGENDKTYLEIPKKIQYGKFLCAAVAPKGEWKEVIADKEMYYQDNEGNKHPTFSRSEWFINSKFMTQQKEGGTTESALNNSSPAANGGTAGNTNW